eukprot:694486-Pleurochrysis_carterae.AAC.1
MSFSSVHRGGATRDLPIELRRPRLGSCGSGGLGGCFGGRLLCVPPGCRQWSSRPRGRAAFIAKTSLVEVGRRALITFRLESTQRTAWYAEAKKAKARARDGQDHHHEAGRCRWYSPREEDPERRLWGRGRMKLDLESTLRRISQANLRPEV